MILVGRSALYHEGGITMLLLTIGGKEIPLDMGVGVLTEVVAR
jgi:hypothetical protein